MRKLEPMVPTRRMIANIFRSNYGEHWKQLTGSMRPRKPLMLDSLHWLELPGIGHKKRPAGRQGVFYLAVFGSGLFQLDALGGHCLLRLGVIGQVLGVLGRGALAAQAGEVLAQLVSG